MHISQLGKFFDSIQLLSLSVDMSCIKMKIDEMFGTASNIKKLYL